MDVRTESLIVEESLPNGDCSFNAFVLGWCRPDILDKVDQLKPPRQYPSNILSDFIQTSAHALGVGMSWGSVKNKLLFLRYTDTVRLQLQMAPVFRHLSVNLARHNRVFRQHTEMHLKSAFRDFVMPIRKSVDDDIVSRHQFIREKFAELNPVPRRPILSLFVSPPKPSEQVLTVAMNKLIDWWFAQGPESGYERFLQAMAKQKEWAGYNELGLLADFFDVNMYVYNQDLAKDIHINYGSVEKKLFSEDQIMELRYRGIVYEDSEVDSEEDAVLRFMPLTVRQVEERLSALPDCDRIREFVLNAAETLKTLAVPAEWRVSLSQLIQRNIIKKQDDNYLFNCDGNTAANLLEEFPGKENMLRLWRLNYISSNPTIRLKRDAAHYDNLSSRAQQEELYSFKFQLTTLIAGYTLYMAMLKRFSSQRLNFFARHALCLPSTTHSVTILTESKPEM